LRRREIIHPPALLPHYLTDPRCRRRLDACRGRPLIELLREEAGSPRRAAERSAPKTPRRGSPLDSV
ncbi:MAG: hypothetical protein ACREJB_08260, partial [Planctomycetaceae bacterium]